MKVFSGWCTLQTTMVVEESVITMEDSQSTSSRTTSAASSSPPSLAQYCRDRRRWKAILVDLLLRWKSFLEKEQQCERHRTTARRTKPIRTWARYLYLLVIYRSSWCVALDSQLLSSTVTAAVEAARGEWILCNDFLCRQNKATEQWRMRPHREYTARGNMLRLTTSEQRRKIPRKGF